MNRLHWILLAGLFFAPLFIHAQEKEAMAIEVVTTTPAFNPKHGQQKAPAKIDFSASTLPALQNLDTLSDQAKQCILNAWTRALKRDQNCKATVGRAPAVAGAADRCNAVVHKAAVR